MRRIGSLSTLPNDIGVDVEWRIQNFFSLDHSYCSPKISFGGQNCHLMIFPHGWVSRGPNKHIDLHLIGSFASRTSLEFYFSLKTVNGEKDREVHSSKLFERTNCHLSIRFMRRSQLVRRQSELVPSGVLTVMCTMKIMMSARSSILNWNKEACNESTKGKKRKMEDENDAESLCQDYKKVLLHGSHHDLILKVGDRELRAHQDILKARSRVFESMLTHDMSEKNNGIIDIPDCDPLAMEQFLSYVYCGKVESLDPSNMLALYYIADKYEMQCLKEECQSFIEKSLSPTNICEVIQLALNHSNSSLLENATQYFMDNTVDILQTVEWQLFMKEKSTVANELLIKSFKKQK